MNSHSVPSEPVAAVSRTTALPSTLTLRPPHQVLFTIHFTCLHYHFHYISFPSSHTHVYTIITYTRLHHHHTHTSTPSSHTHVYTIITHTRLHHHHIHTSTPSSHTHVYTIITHTRLHHHHTHTSTPSSHTHVYTMATSTPPPHLSLPTFSSKPEEDFAQFLFDFDLACQANDRPDPTQDEDLDSDDLLRFFQTCT